MGRAWFAAPLLAVALFVVSAASALAADEGDSPMVVSADQSGSLGLVSTAQSDVEADPEDGTDRRLVGRESSERVDAIVIALWSIAAGMTVMLGIFLWHTSPRRRLRLARRRSTGRYEPDEDESEGGPAEEGSGDPEGGPAEERPVEEGSGDPEQESAEERSAEERSAEEGSGDPEQESAEDGSGDPEQESAEEESGDPEQESAEEGSGDPEQESAEDGSGDPEQESAEDGSDERTSLRMLTQRAGMRLIRWMGS